MGENQRGFKSLVYRMKTMKGLSEANCVTGDRAWEGRLGESHQPMNKNLIRGRRDRVSWHNTAKPCHSVPEANEAVGWRRFSSLPGEISTARGRESGSAVRSNALGDSREVSRGHSTAIENRGAGIRPFKLGNPPARSGKDRTDTMGRPGHPSCTSTPNGSVLRVGIGAGQRKRARAKAPLFRKERRRTFVTSG